MKSVALVVLAGWGASGCCLLVVAKHHVDAFELTLALLACLWTYEKFIHSHAHRQIGCLVLRSLVVLFLGGTPTISTALHTGFASGIYHGMSTDLVNLLPRRWWEKWDLKRADIIASRTHVSFVLFLLLLFLHSYIEFSNLFELHTNTSFYLVASELLLLYRIFWCLVELHKFAGSRAICELNHTVLQLMV